MIAKGLRTALWIVFFIGWFAATGVLMHVATGALGLRSFMPSVGAAAGFGAILGTLTLAAMQVGRRGWKVYDGVWRRGSSAARVKSDRERLARDRDDILAAARAKAGDRCE
jgi:hypothetical protein